MKGGKISERTLRYRRRSAVVVGTKKQRYVPRKKQKTEHRPWADLHEDMLRIIKSKLCLSDQVRFGAVCKSWRLSGKPMIAMAYFSKHCYSAISPDPWDDSSDRDVTFACEIYDSCGEKIHKVSYCISEEGWPSIFYRWPEVCASKDGWLLIIDCAHTAGTVTLCNPFSNLVLSVPRLGHQIDVATFSTIPTSSNCIIFVFYRSWGKTHLGFYRFGDKSWTRLIIAERKAAAEVLSVVYIEGVLYYVFEDGMLGCFSYSGKYCSVLAETFPKRYSKTSFVSYHLVEYGGQVLLATADEDANWCIFRYDESKKAWIAGVSLGKWALCISSNSFVVQAVGDQLDLADCICYFDYETHDLKVYSLKDKQLKDPEHEILTCSDTFDLKHDLTIWIDPPNI